MNRVDTTASITPAWTRSCLEGAHAAVAVKALWGRLLSAAVCLLLSVLFAGPALAREPVVLQTGLVQNYLLVQVLGVILFVLTLLGKLCFRF